MKRFLLLLLMVFFVTVTNVEAAAYKGQRVFSKQCARCHGKQKFIASKTKEEWKAVFKNKGQNLAKLHLKEQKAKASWSYFKSKKYAKKARHLKDFLVEYAKDSGKVPACN